MRPLRFRVVALIAAYGLALHALLSAFGIVAPAAASAAHIAGLCSDFKADQNNAPIEHDAGCDMACAMLGDGLAAPAPPAVAIDARVVVSVLGIAVSQTPLPPVAKGPQRARAPPPV